MPDSARNAGGRPRGVPGALNLARAVGPLRRLGRSTLVAYGQVLFSSRPLVGLLFLVATFTSDPFVGAAGLVAALAANLTARAVWHDRVRWELGLAAYNAVLLGLALGFFLPQHQFVFLLAAAGGAGTALLTERLNRLFARVGLPVLGLPFLAATWLVLAFTTGLRAPPPSPLALPVPEFVNSLLSVFGLVFFSPGPVSGLLVLAGLAVASRISAGIALSCAVLAALLTPDRHLLGPLSINLVIAPIGLAFFLAPNRRLPLYVAGGAAVTWAAVLALEPLFHALQSAVLILPLSVVLFAFLLAGRARLLGVELVPTRFLHSPEDNIRLYRRARRPALQLPFFGTWFVSQGVDGGVTHKGALGHAWDFMVRDERFRTFAVPGYRLEDYHAFGLQVCAPAEGRVAAVEDSVPDNPPGKTNQQQNWGNWVVIEHASGEYSILAHLRRGSVRVKPGDRVEAGTVVGQCGNSGFSGQPHLHYQLQVQPAPGSGTLPAEFSDFLALSGGEEWLVHRGCPEEGQTVQPLASQPGVRSMLARLMLAAEFEACGRGVRWSCARRGTRAVLAEGLTRVRLVEERAGTGVRLYGSRRTWLGRAFSGLDFLPAYSRPTLKWSTRQDRVQWSHWFGPRVGLSGGDALVLESACPGLRRRLWLTADGLVRIDVETGSGCRTATRAGGT